MNGLEQLRDQSPDIPNPEISRFLQFVQANSLPGVQLRKNHSTGCVAFSDSTFIPLDKLKEYFNDCDRLRLLLQSVYGQEEPPVDAETIHSAYLRVFCILVLINRGRWIVACLENDIPDTRLPLRNLPPDLSYITDIDPTLWLDFNRKQWQFYPHKFDLNHISLSFADSLVFPIEWRELIDECDGRSITKIKLHTGYHNLRPLVSDAAGHKGAINNTFVLKSLDGSDSKHVQCFESEVRAFRRLGCNGLAGASKLPPNEIIRFYGSFKHNGIYHILLEYADLGTLQDYFKGTPPPQTQQDLMDFWKSMAAVGKGLACIHNLLPENERIGVFQGYHQDIKLTNILAFSGDTGSRYRVKFKIADLGLSNFVKGQSYVSNASGRGMPGTRTFGSPESHQTRQFSSGLFNAGQASDIWSLACIYSIAATWAIRGWDLVDLYAKKRQQARIKYDRLESDCFHDDEKVLGEVQNWHTFLDNWKMDFDFVTPVIWEKLLQKGFAPASSRVDAIPFQRAATELLRGPSNMKFHEMSMDDAIRSTSADLDRVTTHSPAGETWRANARSRQERLLIRIPEQSSQQDNTRVRHHVLKSNHDREELGDAFNVEFDTDLDSLHHVYNLSRESFPLDNRSSIGNDGQSQNANHNSSMMHAVSEIPSFDRLSDEPHSPIYGHYDPSSPIVPQSSTSDNGALAKDEREMITDSRTNGPINVGHDLKCPLHPNNKKSIDYMSREDLRLWKRAQDEDGAYEVPHSTLKYGLRNRDYVFLFEDSVSMKPHWPDVRKLFSEFAKFLKQCHKNDIEIYSTVSTIRRKGSKTRLLVESVKNMEHHLNSSSQPTVALRKIWNTHKDGICEGKKKRFFGCRQKKGLTIYVFTDGVWQQGAYTDIKNLLKEIIECLKASKCEDKHFGIQFIQFGVGEVETERLKTLDKDIGQELQLDIVDREPANGNVWKMLLGTINAYFDDDYEAQCECRVECAIASKS